MKKPINKFAIILWVLAIIVFASEVSSLFWTRQIMHQIAGASHFPGETFFVVLNIHRELQLTVLVTSVIAALGVLIELVDQIRWNALHKQSDK